MLRHGVLLAVAADVTRIVDATQVGWRCGSVQQSCGETCAEQTGSLSCTDESVARQSHVGNPTTFAEVLALIGSDATLPSPWTCTSFISDFGPSYDAGSPTVAAGVCRVNAAVGLFTQVVTEGSCDTRAGGRAPLCCCLAAGEDAATACPLNATCGVGTVWDLAKGTCVVPGEQGWRTATALGQSCDTVCAMQPNGPDVLTCYPRGSGTLRLVPGPGYDDGRAGLPVITGAISADPGAAASFSCTMANSIYDGAVTAFHKTSVPAYAPMDGKCYSGGGYGHGMRCNGNGYNSVLGSFQFLRICCCYKHVHPETACALTAADCGAVHDWDAAKGYCVPKATSASPTTSPSTSPSASPSASPSTSPSSSPSSSPTRTPSSSPTTSTSSSPSSSPSAAPSNATSTQAPARVPMTPSEYIQSDRVISICATRGTVHYDLLTLTRHCVPPPHWQSRPGAPQVPPLGQPQFQARTLSRREQRRRRRSPLGLVLASALSHCAFS
mgnify:CR=1 FL=1